MWLCKASDWIQNGHVSDAWLSTNIRYSNNSSTIPPCWFGDKNIWEPVFNFLYVIQFPVPGKMRHRSLKAMLRRSKYIAIRCTDDSIPSIYGCFSWATLDAWFLPSTSWSGSFLFINAIPFCTNHHGAAIDDLHGVSCPWSASYAIVPSSLVHEHSTKCRERPFLKLPSLKHYRGLVQTISYW